MKGIRFIELLRDWIVIAIGVFLAAHFVKGITYDNGTTLFLVVILLSIFNIFLKPVLVLITLPFIILTFGLMLWIINALLFMLAGWLVDGFYVDSFFAALMGALIVSLVTMMANALFKKRNGGDDDSGSSGSGRGWRRRGRDDRDDVIDI